MPAGESKQQRLRSKNRLSSLFTPASNPGRRFFLLCFLEVSERWSEETGVSDGEAEGAVRGEGPFGSAEGHAGQNRGRQQGGDITGKADFNMQKYDIWSQYVIMGSLSTCELFTCDSH